jgi:predicted dienelactone hydrolase
MSTIPLIAAASIMLAPCGTAATPLAPFPSPQAVQGRPAIRDGITFSRLTVADGDQPALEVGVWQPTETATGRRPMIVISHGNGGNFRSHGDTAQALAKAGFVVAALTHTGDNSRDQSRATDLAGRSRQLSVLIDYMLGAWDGKVGIDAARIGAFGYSAGGFTVLAAAGGNPDLTRLVDHCRTNPAFYDCRLVSQQPRTMNGSRTPLRLPHDARLKALVVAAPALGFTFTRDGLAAVTQPVQLWQAGNDQILPSPFYAEPVRDALPHLPEYIHVHGAGHFDFLPPCSPDLAAKAPMICLPTPGFARGEFHETLKREMIRFFKTHL